MISGSENAESSCEIKTKARAGEGRKGRHRDPVDHGLSGRPRKGAILPWLHYESTWKSKAMMAPKLSRRPPRANDSCKYDLSWKVKATTKKTKSYSIAKTLTCVLHWMPFCLSPIVLILETFEVLLWLASSNYIARRWSNIVFFKRRQIK